jgi:hypothetical protein
MMFPPKTLLVAMASLLLLTGCQSAGKDSSEDWSMSSPNVGSAPDMASSEAFDSAVDVSGNRVDIVTGDMYVTVDDTSVAAGQVTEIVTKAGGRVDSRTDFVDQSTNSPSTYLWVRIPAPVLDDTLEAITQLGVVERTSISRVDVTLQTIDLAERIKVLNNSLDRLNDLLDQASTTSELIELETAITQRQAERDSLVSQQNYLSDQIQFASVSIELRTAQDAPPREPSGFGDAIVAGWFALVAFASASLIFLGMSLPWLAVVAIVVLPVVWGLRRRARRQNTRSDN